MEEPIIEIKDPKQKQSKADTFSSYQIFVIIILALMQFTVILDFMILAPLGDILMKKLDMSTAQFGKVVSGYAISAGISGILAAGFADKFDRKKMLMVFYVGFVVGTFFCGLAYNYTTLLIARIFTGLFGGVIGAIGMAIITDLFSLNQRGRVMGFVQMGFAASQVLGVPIGLLLTDIWGWHSTFFMLVVLALVIGVAVVLKLKPITEHLKTPNGKNPLEHLWHTVKKRDYRIGFFATALLSLGGFMIMPFTTAFLVNNVEIEQEDLKKIFFFTGIASIIIMPIVGKLSDKIDKFKLFTVGTIIASIMVLIYTNLTPVPLWVVIGINMIMFMGIMSRMVPSQALSSSIPASYDRGAYMSINGSLQQMAGGIAALFAGLIVVQETKAGPMQENKLYPIEHFDILGYIMVGTFALCLVLVYRVSQIIKKRALENKSLS